MFCISMVFSFQVKRHISLGLNNTAGNDDIRLRTSLSSLHGDDITDWLNP